MITISQCNWLWCRFNNYYFIIQPVPWKDHPDNSYVPENEYYHYVNIGLDNIYLHSDGVWRRSAKDMESGEYTGFYKSKEEAEATLQKYNEI
jgi:hypothetical protein